MSDNSCYVCSGSELVAAGRYGAYRTEVCIRCGHQQCVPMPTADDLDEFYQSSYHACPPDRPYGQDPRYVERRYSRIGERVKRLHPEIKRVVEIGCSSGYGLAQLKRMGFEVAGVEISSKCAEHARSVLGMDVRQGVSTPSEFEGKFDAAFSMHAIEHTPEPLSHLAGLVNAVRPGGWIIVATPNGAFRPAVYSKVWNWLQPLHHVNVFSPESLRRILERGGLVDIEVAQVVDHPEINHLAPVIADTLRYGRKGTPGPAADGSDHQVQGVAPEGRSLGRRMRRAAYQLLRVGTFPGYAAMRTVFPSWRETVIGIARVP